MRRLVQRHVLILSKTVNAVVRRCGLSRTSFHKRHFGSVPKRLGKGGSLLYLAHPRMVRSVRQGCLITNTSVVRAGDFGTASISVTSCRIRTCYQRVGLTTTHLTHQVTSRFATLGPRGPHFITNSIKPAGGAYSVDPSMGGPTFHTLAFSRLRTTCYRRVRTLLRKKISTLLVRAVFSALGTGTTVQTTRLSVRGAKHEMPLVLSIAISSVTKHALSKRALSTFLTSIRRTSLFSIKLGYSFNTHRLGPFLRRLTSHTPCCVDTCPGTKLPGSLKRCSRAPRSVTTRIGRCVRRKLIGVVKKYYNAARRCVTGCRSLVRKMRPHIPIGGRTRL